ncbi:hypothetical protein CsSME_00053786 [Camellia sinensis var. sinensis]
MSVSSSSPPKASSSSTPPLPVWKESLNDMRDIHMQKGSLLQPILIHRDAGLWNT